MAGRIVVWASRHVNSAEGILSLGLNSIRGTGRKQSGQTRRRVIGGRDEETQRSFIAAGAGRRASRAIGTGAGFRFATARRKKGAARHPGEWHDAERQLFLDSRQKRS